MGQSTAQPLLDIRDKLVSWANKMESYGNPIGDNSQTMNWKPEPNDEQKAQIKRDQQKSGTRLKSAQTYTGSKPPVKRKRTSTDKR